MSVDAERTRKRLIRSFRDTFPDGLPDDVALATMENTAGWDSMATWTLLMLVQEQFGVTIGLDLIPSLSTFARFEEVVTAKLAAKDG